MKILTKEEKDAHYRATLQGGIAGGLVGLCAGALGVFAATRRYYAFRNLTVPLRAFLITSSGTFASIIAADHASRSFELDRHPNQHYVDDSEKANAQVVAEMSNTQRLTTWARENRYGIVGGSWVASMAVALALVGRNPYLSGPQKLVQARVYAQGLTVAVLIATAAFEISDQRKGQGRYETVKVLDPNDPTHKHLIDRKIHHESYAGEDQWKDMIEAEERRMKEREEHVRELEGKRGKQNRKKADPSHDGAAKIDGASKPKTLP